MAIAHPAPAAEAVERARVVSREAPGSAAVTVLVSISMAVALFMLYALWKFWPTQAILKSDAAQPVSIFGFQRSVTADVRLLVVVALAGAIGGQMHSTRSLAWYVGHQGLKWRWVPYYLVTIVLGAGLASIFYLIIRGGIVSSNSTSAADANPYGFAALGALVGLFTEQAMEMLRRVANQVFAMAPQGADTVRMADENAGNTAASTRTAAALAAKTGNASNVTASTATVEGDVTPSGEETSYYFDYGTSSGYGATTPAQVIGRGSQPVHVTGELNALQVGTEYHFRLVVADAGGAWVTGDDMTFTTLGG
jgi:hypothetical protein